MIPNWGIWSSALVRPTGLTQEELVLHGRGVFGLRPQTPTKLWGGAMVGKFVFFGTCSASFVNHARRETYGITVSDTLYVSLTLSQYGSDPAILRA